MVTDILNAAFYYAFLCSALYISGCTVMSPWWRNPWSRGMVIFSFASLLILLPVVLHLAFGVSFRSGLASWYYIGSLFLAGSIELYRLRWVYRIQQEDTPRDDAPDDGSEPPG